MDMQVTIRGRRWRLKTARLTAALGYCDSPNETGKTITISDKVDGQVLIEALIHEMLHAATWDSSEEMVSETARDIARVLYRLGCRIDE